MDAPAITLKNKVDIAQTKLLQWPPQILNKYR